MPHFTLQLDPSSGPVLTAFVSVSSARFTALQAQGKPAPNPVQIRALVDTGASCTCIDPNVLRALELTPTGSIPVHTPSTGATPHTAEQYDVGLLIPPAVQGHQPLVIEALPVLSSDLATQGIQALIGRDILRNCVMMYNGTIALFTLAF